MAMSNDIFARKGLFISSAAAVAAALSLLLSSSHVPHLNLTNDIPSAEYYLAGLRLPKEHSNDITRTSKPQPDYSFLFDSFSFESGTAQEFADRRNNFRCSVVRPDLPHGWGNFYPCYASPFSGPNPVSSLPKSKRLAKAGRHSRRASNSAKGTRDSKSINTPKPVTAFQALTAPQIFTALQVFTAPQGFTVPPQNGLSDIEREREALQRDRAKFNQDVAAYNKAVDDLNWRKDVYVVISLAIATVTTLFVALNALSSMLNYRLAKQNNGRDTILESARTARRSNALVPPLGNLEAG
jgi:hypothetical protein